MPYFIGQLGTTVNSGIAISSGKIDKLSGIHKFGYNDTITTAAETVWESGGVYSTYPTSGAALELTNTVTDGTDDGVEITIEGLDYDYNLLTETVTTESDGGGVTDSGAWIRVFRAYVSGDQALTGNVNIHTEGDSGEQWAYINNAYQQTQMAVYTVPAGKTAYLTKLEVGYDKQNDYEVRVMVREPGKVFRCQGVLTGFAESMDRHFEIPFHIPEKSDIRIDAKCGATGGVSAAFDLVLEDE